MRKNGKQLADGAKTGLAIKERSVFSLSVLGFKFQAALSVVEGPIRREVR
jgi:hypothetical protein